MNAPRTNVNKPYGRSEECINCYYGGSSHRSGSTRQIVCAEHKTKSGRMDFGDVFLPVKSPSQSSLGLSVTDLSKKRQQAADSFDKSYLEDSLNADLERYTAYQPNSKTHAELRGKAFMDLEKQLKAFPASVDEVMRESNAIDSITGNIMEQRYASVIGGLQSRGTIMSSQDKNIKPPYKAVSVEAYMSGKDSYKVRVKEVRDLYSTSSKEEKRELVKRLAFEFMLKRDYVRQTLEDPKVRITRLPDAMVRLRLVKEDGTVERVVRPVEMKLAGRHDSKSVEANIKALHDAMDDRIDVPKGYKVQPAIAITSGTVEGDKGIMVETRWKNAIEKNNYDMKVVSNEEAFSFLSGRSYSADDYHEKYVAPIARLAAVRLFRRIHGEIELPTKNIGNFLKTGKL